MVQGFGEFSFGDFEEISTAIDTVEHLWQGQDRYQLLTPVGLTYQEPHRDQGYRHMVRP